MDYEEYEKQCNEIRRINEQLLILYEQSLSRFSNKTIYTHLSNVEFYLNTYLLYIEPQTFDKGADCLNLDGYFGDYFIRKCMWSNLSTIKSTAASIKKFYKCMYKNELINEELYQECCLVIKNHINEWLDTYSRYYNLSKEWW